MKETYPKQPGNYELQAAYLQQMQQGISQDLFLSGVSSRLISPADGDSPDLRGAHFPLQGVDQLDILFAPCLATVTLNDRQETVLSLAAIKDEANTRGLPSRSYAYKKIGMIDTSGVLMQFPDVSEDDAAAVHQAAKQLEAARDSGELPDLAFSLLYIKNPNTAIRKA